MSLTEVRTTSPSLILTSFWTVAWRSKRMLVLPSPPPLCVSVAALAIGLLL